jgi:hypothetical protein
MSESWTQRPMPKLCITDLTYTRMANLNQVQPKHIKVVVALWCFPLRRKHFIKLMTDAYRELPAILSLYASDLPGGG